jgi:hypothetical protein
MKNIHSLLALGALASVLLVPGSGFAEEPVAKPSSASSGEVKTLGMYTKVDAIDASANTFTHKNKDGKEVKFVVTGKTVIKNGDKPATLADIKVGDTVSGSRIKKSDTEYEVVKITKFGVAAPKPKKTAAPAKPTESKP